MLEDIFKVILKVIKNKKFTQFSNIITLLIVVFMLSNAESSLVQTIIFLFQFSLVKVGILLIASFLLCHNIQLGLLFIVLIGVIMNIPYIQKETFVNIPNGG